MYDDDFNYDDDNKQSGLSLFYETNKKLVWLLVGIILFIVILSIIIKISNKEKSPQELPINVVVSNKSDVVSIGNTMMVYAEVKNVDNADIEWVSADPSIATVDQNGLVRGISYGTVKILAKYTHTDGSSYYDDCEVIVAEGNKDVKIVNVRFPDGEVLMSVGSTYIVPVLIEPTNGYKTNVAYSSNNANVASIDQSGSIKALKEGSTTIKINVNNGEFTDTITVNVTSGNVNPQILISPKNISFNETEKTLTVGDSYQVIYNIYPQNSTPTSYEWTSSNSSVASVNNGYVTALKSGKTEIVLKSKYNNAYGKLILTVVDKKVEPQAVMISSQSVLNLKVGETSQILASIIPNNATDQTINYNSNNINIATVDNKGLITAVGEGQTIITLSTNNGKTVLISVNVTKNSSSSSESDGSYSLNITSNTKTVNSTYEKVMRDVALAKEEVIVSVDYSGKIDKVGICVVTNYQENGDLCDPQSYTNVTINNSGEAFRLNQNGVTQFSYVAYDANGNIVTTGSRFVRIQLDNGNCYLNTTNGRYVWGNFYSNNFVLKSQYKTKEACLKNNE